MQENWEDWEKKGRGKEESTKRRGKNTKKNEKEGRMLEQKRNKR